MRGPKPARRPILPPRAKLTHPSVWSGSLRGPRPNFFSSSFLFLLSTDSSGPLVGDSGILCGAPPILCGLARVCVCVAPLGVCGFGCTQGDQKIARNAHDVAVLGAATVRSRLAALGAFAHLGGETPALGHTAWLCARPGVWRGKPVAGTATCAMAAKIGGGGGSIRQRDWAKALPLGSRVVRKSPEHGEQRGFSCARWRAMARP